MWFYPLPSLVALVGWVFVLGMASWETKLAAVAVLASGSVVFLVWRFLWPKSPAVLAEGSPSQVSWITLGEPEPPAAFDRSADV